jgi:allantoinase
MKDQLKIFALHSSRVVTESGIKDLTICIKDGIITDLLPGKIDSPEYPLEDMGNLVIMPGLIDSHVHVNEPGRTEWEGFETITKAAVAGGITTLVDMPLNASPVTTTSFALQEKIASARGKLYCNCGFWGGIVPDNLNVLEDLIESGVLGIKAFLTHSGIDDFPNVSIDDLRIGMPIIAKHKVPLLAHAELDEPHAGVLEFELNPSSYMAFLRSRPNAWEDKAVELMIRLCRETNCRVHIVHLSSASSLPMIRAAKAEGLPLTVETCPHYLFFCAEDIPDGSPVFKCTPPIRERANNELLWEALKDGTIDFIVTDHSPATPELKKLDSGNLKQAWGGIASIQFSLPVVWTGAKRRGMSLNDLSNLMSTHVARFLGFGESKGLIRKGYDADLTVWDPDKLIVVQAKDIEYRHKISPYLNEKLFGAVSQTYVGGIKVFEQGNFVSFPLGKILLK